MSKVHPFAEEARAEQRTAKLAADAFACACRTGKATDLHALADQLGEHVGCWTAAMRAVARRVQSVSPDIRQAFLGIWIEHKMLALRVGDHRALCDAARVLLPSYRGPAMRLFRGASARERRRRTYGLSWTANITVAKSFARERQQWPSGSVVLETQAPATAIICAVAYPEPFNNDELAREYSGMPPNTIQALLDKSQGFHEEHEYVVDRRHLKAVTVARRYAQVGGI